MAGPNAQIVGRVGIRVVPDTSLFREQLAAELRAMRGNVQEINLAPNVRGFNNSFRNMIGNLGRRARVDVDGRLRPGLLRRLQSELGRGLTLGNVGDDIDLSALNRFERIMLTASIHANRMYASLREVARNMQTVGRHADYTRIQWARIGANLASIPKHLRDGLRNADPYGSTLDQINAVLRDMGRYVTDVRGRFADLRRVAGYALGEVNDEATGIERALGNRFRRAMLSAQESARAVLGAMRLVNNESGRHAREIGEHRKEVGLHRKGVIGLRTVWVQAGETARALTNEFRAMREISSYNRLQLVDEDAPRLVQRLQGSILGLARDSNALNREWMNIRFSFSRAAAIVKDFATNSVGAMDVWRRLGQGAANLGRGIRALPGQIARSRQAQEGLYEGFIRTGNAATTMGILGGRATAGLVRGLRSLRTGFLHPIRSIRSMTSSMGGMHRESERSSRGLRNLSKVALTPFKAMGSLLKGVVSGLGSMGSALGSVFDMSSRTQRILLLIVAVLVILPPLIGLVAGLLAGLPSLLLAGGAAFAAVALGMEGIKAAAKTLTPEVDRLKASLSQTFQQGLTPVFESLRPVFGTLETGLNKVAQSLVHMAGGVRDVILEADRMGIIESILGNTAQFFKDLTPFIQTSLRGFLAWADAGAQMFPTLSGLLNDFGTQWQIMAQRVVDSGSFRGAIEGLASVVGTLFTEWLRLLEYGLGAMQRLGEPISTLFTGLVDIFLGLAPALEAIFILLADVVGALGTALGPAMAALAPMFQELLAVVSPFIAQLGQQLAPIFMQLADTLNALLIPVFQALQPVLQTVLDVFGQIALAIGNGLNMLLPILIPFIQQVVGYFSQLWAAISPLVPALMNLAMVIFQALLDIIIALLPFFIQFVQSVLPKLLDLVRILAPALTVVVNVLAQIIPHIANFVVWLLENLMPAFESVRSTVDSVWNGVRTIIQGALDIVIGIIKVFAGILSGDWSMIWEGVKQILTGALEIVVGLFIALVPTILDWLAALGEGIIGFFADAGRWLWDAGVAIIQGLWDGLLHLWERVKGWVRSIGDWIAQNKGPLSYDRRLLIPAGKAIMQGLLAGLETGWTPVQDEVLGMANWIEDQFSDSTIGVNSQMNSLVGSAEFGVNSEGIAGAVANGLAGATLRVDGNGLAKFVNKNNTRMDRRGR